MIKINTVIELKKIMQDHSSKRIGFVPTMGALHEGHSSLIEKSLSQNDLTVVSIYLNSTQFNDPGDLQKYPSNLESDLKMMDRLGVDVVFSPDYDEMYPENYRYKVSENQLSLDLCGKNRPGHFDGVLTIVLKLLNIIKPDKAYFGEKDYQQLSLIRGMIKSFFIDTEIISCPTKRDSGGLALSSRNERLDENDKLKAQFFAKSLREAESLEKLETLLKEKNIFVDYLKDVGNRRYAAVKIGEVRLIDNVTI